MKGISNNKERLINDAKECLRFDCSGFNEGIWKVGMFNAITHKSAEIFVTAFGGLEPFVNQIADDILEKYSEESLVGWHIVYVNLTGEKEEENEGIR